MTYPAVPLGGQWTHRTLAERANMNARVDVPLNAGAAVMRGQPGDNRMYATLRSNTGIGNGATVKWDTEMQDPLGAYNPATGVWTCPTSGLYLMSVKMTSTNAVSFQMRVYGLNVNIYVANYVATQLTAALSGGESAAVSAFPLYATAGEQYYVQLLCTPNTSTVTPDAGAGSDRCSWSIAYVGEFASSVVNPGTVAPTPLVGNQWTQGEPVTDLKLTRRFDDPMDELQPFLTDYGAQRVSFFGWSVGQAIPGDGTTPVPVVPFVDTGGGYNAATGWWNPPYDGGLYVIGAAIVGQADVNASVIVSAGSDPLVYGPPRQSGSGGYKGSTTAVVRRLNASDSVFMLSANAGTSATDLRTYLAVTQIG